jgi:hypothetical protein
VSSADRLAEDAEPPEAFIGREKEQTRGDEIVCYVGYLSIAVG